MHLESLANELLLYLFEFFDGIQLLRAFHDFNSRFNHLLYNHYRVYRIDFHSISKYQFDDLCQYCLPSITDQIISLTISDDDETPNLPAIFLSYNFTLDKFTRLQSLSLYSIQSFAQLSQLIYQCHQLRHLTRLRMFDGYNDDRNNDIQFLINTIWSLPKLQHFYLNYHLSSKTWLKVPNKNKKTDLKNHTAIPNGMSETIDTSESEDEMKKIQVIRMILKRNINKKHLNQREKRIHWVKKPFTLPISTFVGGSLPPPNHSGLEPIDYFYTMFGKESFDILKEQSNLYSVQVNPNRPVNISESEIRQFVGILLMTGIYGFPQQRSYWTNSTRVESIASTMSRDRFLEIKKNLHVVDNTNQLSQNDPNYDRAFKVRPLLNIIKNNFRKIQKEEQLCVDE
ncbi:unnamed protein product [Rotaria magnacalcarata]|uniref:PiggyBac transposable element-derived protein domain-containing protein n=3 Tax=Rotaria magnacalcarata TaxID=392030 RepID=A0A8S2S8J2_9BILA|nr:unnamed protein product [Rotaria magnacalcarata]